MKVRVTLITGMQIDFDAPEDFNVGSFALSVRETGRWLMDTCYVPHDKIVSIIRVDQEGKPITPKVEGTLQ